MSSSVLTEIENRFDELSLDEQLWLIERLAHRLRKSTLTEQTALQAELAAMAADPPIQSELRKINEEFAVTESDGLENL